MSETHIAILKEPGSIFLGYTVASENDKLPAIAENLESFFAEQEISWNKLIAIGCGGELKNTGKNTGVIRNLELKTQRPLHWFIYLLHSMSYPSDIYLK